MSKIAVDFRPGHRGNSMVTDTVARAAATADGPWSEIYVVAEATFETLTDRDEHGSSNGKTGFAWPAGSILTGDFTAVKLTSGKVCLYKGPTSAA